jgi:hypothetical protein
MALGAKPNSHSVSPLQLAIACNPISLKAFRKSFRLTSILFNLGEDLSLSIKPTLLNTLNKMFLYHFLMLKSPFSP